MARANSSKYTPQLANKIRHLIENHNTPYRDICRELDISESTFYAWQNPNSKWYIQEVSEIIAQAREVFWQRTVDEIENAMKKKALGYEYEEVTEKARKNPAGDKWVEVTKTKKHIAPDAKSAQIMLNRAGKYYMNKVEIEIDDTASAFDLLKKAENELHKKTN